jgi:hypothetical protein
MKTSKSKRIIRILILGLISIAGVFLLVTQKPAFAQTDTPAPQSPSEEPILENKVSMTSNTLSLLAQIATWVTVVLVFFTFFEMVKQRKATYKPDIVIGKTYIHAYMSDQGLPDIWLNNRIADNEKLDLDNSFHDFCLPVHNLGLGAARDVKFEWYLDLNDFIERVKQISKSTSLSFEMSISDNNWLNFKFSDKFNSSINLNFDLLTEVDFILPVAERKFEPKLRLPYSYVFLVSLYILCQVSRTEQDTLENHEIDIPKLELSIHYKDIGDSKHSKKYIFEFSIIMITYAEFSTGDLLFSADLEQS